MEVNNLKGRFHAHITLLSTDFNFEAPHGWKTTIILLSKGHTEQVDVMVTRHFMVGHEKTPDVESVMEILKSTTAELNARGHEVLRVKLEHEDLPTLAPSKENYRECHIKVSALAEAPRMEHYRGTEYTTGMFIPYRGFVRSSNPIECNDKTETFFYNARFRKEYVAQVDHKIRHAVEVMKRLNPSHRIMEVKIETTVFDTNQKLDAWWA